MRARVPLLQRSQWGLSRFSSDENGTVPLGSAWLVLLILVAGCRGDRGPALVPVQGRVTLDGKPLALKSVRFIPEQGTPGAGGEATTKEDGTYALYVVRPGSLKPEYGILPGSYVVVVTEPTIPIGTPKVKESPDQPAITPADAAALQRSPIPRVYTQPETTSLRATIRPNEGAVDLALTSRPAVPPRR